MCHIFRLDNSYTFGTLSMLTSTSVHNFIGDSFIVDGINCGDISGDDIIDIDELQRTEHACFSQFSYCNCSIMYFGNY